MVAAAAAEIKVLGSMAFVPIGLFKSIKGTTTSAPLAKLSKLSKPIKPMSSSKVLKYQGAATKAAKKPTTIDNDKENIANTDTDTDADATATADADFDADFDAFSAPPTDAYEDTLAYPDNMAEDEDKDRFQSSPPTTTDTTTAASNDTKMKARAEIMRCIASAGKQKPIGLFIGPTLTPSSQSSKAAARAEIIKGLSNTEVTPNAAYTASFSSSSSSSSAAAYSLKRQAAGDFSRGSSNRDALVSLRGIIESLVTTAPSNQK